MNHHAQSKTVEETQAVQALLDEARLTGKWFVTAVAGNHADPIARFTAQRIVPGGRAFSVVHDDAKALLTLCREADLRFDNRPQGVTVTSGTADTHNTGG